MTCKLSKTNTNGTISMFELPGGKIAVVVEGRYKGSIVQKENSSGRHIILGEGMKIAHKCSGAFSSDCVFRVRILEEGELIEVKYS